MTPQEIFNKVWDHLNRQGKPARGSEGECCYRAPDGSACAVGCLVNEETAKLWDANLASGIEHIVRSGEYVPNFIQRNSNLLAALQRAHDRPADSDWLTEWRARMAQIADNYNLTVPPIPDTNA